jgi:hypothetical protein
MPVEPIESPLSIEIRRMIPAYNQGRIHDPVEEGPIFGGGRNHL